MQYNYLPASSQVLRAISTRMIKPTFQEFRQNVLSNLNDSCFNRAICEVMLNQKYFNGIGNYLRAEILFRLNIQPFEVARLVLQPIKDSDDVGVKREGPDLVDLCHALPLEVIGLGAGKGVRFKEETSFSSLL